MGDRQRWPWLEGDRSSRRSRPRLRAWGCKSASPLLGVKPARPTLHLGRCLVVPSLAESLPYVILEGAAAGLPVIATDVGGVSEIYGPTAASLLPAADAGALQRTMQAALDDPTAAAHEAELRLAHIRAGFSVAHMADQIEALYRQVLVTRRQD